MIAEAGTVGIVGKPSHPLAAALARQTLEVLAERGIDHLIDPALAPVIGGVAADHIAADREALARASSVIVVLGGDGTLISASRHAGAQAGRDGDSAAVIIGVNLGTLGFLTEIDPEELVSTLDAVLSGNAPVESRALLDAAVIRNGRVEATFSALNDVVITKETLARIFATEVSIDECPAAVLRGDGVIIATPVGSTAYSLAAGGSIVHPGVPALLVTPICPHSLTSRPLVVPATSRVTLTLAPSSGSHETSPVYLTIDGQQGMPLRSGDRIEVTTSGASVRFAKSSSKSYFDVLRTKLQWARG